MKFSFNPIKDDWTTGDLKIKFFLRSPKDMFSSKKNRKKLFIFFRIFDFIVLKWLKNFDK